MILRVGADAAADLPLPFSRKASLLSPPLLFAGAFALPPRALLRNLPPLAHGASVHVAHPPHTPRVPPVPPPLAAAPLEMARARDASAFNGARPTPQQELAGASLAFARVLRLKVRLALPQLRLYYLRPPVNGDQWLQRQKPWAARRPAHTDASDTNGAGCSTRCSSASSASRSC
jgi:hypothetical protein